MSESQISSGIQRRIWARSAGICQFRGCTEDLTRDDLTRAQFNAAYLAHIVADSPGGKRGDVILSPLLAQDFDNIMLLCDKHHRLIDTDPTAADYPRKLLVEMKRESEERIARLVTASIPNVKTEIVLYVANIGDQSPVLNFKMAAQAISPLHPTSDRGIQMQMLNSRNKETDPSFWHFEEQHLLKCFSSEIAPRQRDGSLPRLSIFAIAPQPLLMRLGALLTDIPDAEVFQLRREPQSWKWGEDESERTFVLEKLTDGNVPALIFSLSATIDKSRVLSVLPNAAIWSFTVATPSRDVIGNREHLRLFREQARIALDTIKSKEGHDKVLHVFPAMPVSAAVEFGRIRMPKADYTIQTYDEIKDMGFTPALKF